MDVALSILTVDYADVRKSLENILDCVDYVHLDVMDGEFVPNISFGYSFIKSLRKLTDKPFDTHLMMVHPNHYIKQFVEAGSDYITFHIEADCDAKETIDLIHSFNVKAGISIKPNTSVDEIKDLLPYLDMVLVMSVEPGFGGQKFMPIAIDKVKLLSELKKNNNYKYIINIDGGIKDSTAVYIKDYVDLAVSGSYILNSESPKENALKLKEL
jgi:ribulose-phosphate 3-epimerase